MANNKADTQEHDLTLAVGACIFAWNEMESEVRWLLATVINVDLWTATALFDEISSFDAKIRVLNELVVRSQISAPLKARWEIVRKGMSTRNGNRNQIAHCDLIKRIRPGKKPQWRVIPFNTINERQEGLTLSQVRFYEKDFLHGARDVSSFREHVELELRQPVHS